MNYSHSVEDKAAANEHRRTFPFENGQDAALISARTIGFRSDICGRFCGFISLVVAVFFAVASHAAAASNPRKVIIDTDPGTDDAIAILLALNSPELDVRALTVVPGNVTAKQGLENALKLVSLANRCNVAVAGGAEHPLFQKLITAEFWHGKNGLANVELPPSKCKADPRFGPDLIIQMVHEHPHEITLLPIGPETNIALAVLKDPSIVPLVQEVIVMGGSISGGNVNASAEANIYNDPEAAQIVFQAGWPLTMAGLDVGNATLFTRRHLEQLAKTRGPQNDFMVQVNLFLVELSEKYGFSGSPMYDPLAIGVAIDRTIVKTHPMHVDVETRGEFTRGETVANRQNAVERNVLHGDRYIIEGVDQVTPNVQVCTGVDAERFLQMFISRLQGK
ncbi:MAG TPA: nucleoside hydrolase [Candidatus Sulfotelmatobacter sp.]|nr:nucleoside hydrolase [Candidatus Sulfotelmatobacter sp.]